MLISGAITAVLYLPYTRFFLSRFGVIESGQNWAPYPTLESFYNVLWSFSNEPVVVVLILTAFVAAIVSFFIRKQPASLPSIFLTIAFLLPFVMAFLISLKMPMFTARYLVFISIPFYLLIGVVSVKMGKTTKVHGVIALLFCFLMIITTNLTSGNKCRDDEIAETALQLKGEDGIVVISPWWYFRTFAYHTDKEGFRDYENTVQHLNSARTYPANDLFPELSEAVQTSDRIIYIDTWSSFEPNRMLQREIGKSHQLSKEIVEYEPYRILVFTRQ